MEEKKNNSINLNGLSDLINGDNGKLLIVTLGILAAYAIDSYTKTVKHAMDQGYDSTLELGQNRSIKFTKETSADKTSAEQSKEQKSGLPANRGEAALLAAGV